MPSVRFIIVYFGGLPPWFEYFARSCARNPSIDWLILVEEPGGQVINCPDNLAVHSISRESLEQRVAGALGTAYRFSYGYKLCDLKPVYGHLFADFLEGYDYWGYTDLDLVWGDLAGFIEPALEAGFDVISGSRRILVGHCTLIRNEAGMNGLYRKCDGFPAKLLSSEYEVFDEKDFDETARQEATSGRIRVWMNAIQTEDAIIWWQGRPRFLILWWRGRLFDVFALREIAYFHFIQSKYRKWFRYRSMQEGCDAFFIDIRGIRPLEGPKGWSGLLVSGSVTLLFTLPWYGKLVLKRLLPQGLRSSMRRITRSVMRIVVGR